MRIVIPTYGRVAKQTTLANLPLDIRREVFLITSDPAEADALKKAWKGQIAGVKDAPVKTIADKRQWILENIRDNVFMLDDDIFAGLPAGALSADAFACGKGMTASWSIALPAARQTTSCARSPASNRSCANAWYASRSPPKNVRT